MKQSQSVYQNWHISGADSSRKKNLAGSVLNHKNLLPSYTDREKRQKIINLLNRVSACG